MNVSCAFTSRIPVVTPLNILLYVHRNRFTNSFSLHLKRHKIKQSSSLSLPSTHHFYLQSRQTYLSSSVKNMDTSFIDIGANLLDDMYQGNYRGKERHEADLSIVLQRAFDNNVDRIIITCGTLQESIDGLELAKTDPRLFCTVGVHPTRCSSEFGDSEEEWDIYLSKMKKVIEEGKAEGKVVAIGELGLDYARLQFCDVPTQKKGFIAQLKLAKETNLPLFLHNRDTGTDLLDILKEHYFNGEGDGGSTLAGGVVHSFDDSLELANKFTDLGLYIGINGCSLKTESNINTARDIPLDRLLLETDCPWCDIRASHASFKHVKTKFATKSEKKYESDCYVKGRYEPTHIIQVAEVIAGIKGISVNEVANVGTSNAHKLFGKMEK